MSLSLSEAIKAGKLDRFIAEQEARGVGPINEAEFQLTASTVIRTLP